MPHLCSASSLTKSFLSLLASVYVCNLQLCVCGGGPVWLMESVCVCSEFCIPTLLCIAPAPSSQYTRQVLTLL